MKLSQMVPAVKQEIEKPFQEKLDRAVQLVKLWARRNACVACSFGKDSMVVLCLCLQENPRIPVVFENTGVQFPETYQFKEELRKKWNLNLIETKPAKTFWDIAKEYGLPDGSKRKGRKRDYCCYHLKEKPFRELIQKYNFQVVFTGITALESRIRMFVACKKGLEYYHKRDKLLKVHPILYWTPEEVWKFTQDNNIPVNPAYAKYNLQRLGCMPCTAYKNWRQELKNINPQMYQLLVKLQRTKGS